MTPISSAPSPASNSVTFQIDNTTPTSVTDFRLNPADDTGDLGRRRHHRPPARTSSARPPPGYTVELFVNGQSAVQNTAVAGSTQIGRQRPAL